MKTSNTRLLACVLVALLAHAAQQPTADCGTTVGLAQQEIFLHQRHLIARARSHAVPADAPSTNQDVGQIAVIDDSGGVIGRRNIFNLDNQTVIFQPAGAGYQLRLAGDSFDQAAAQSGQPLTGLADDDSRAVALPFPFPFFGTSYTQTWVDSNGMLTFTAGDTDYSGSYGHFATGPPAIAPLFTDLDPSQSAAGVRVLAEADRLVVTWSNVPLAGSFGLANPPAQNFQVRLYPDGHIEMAYHSTNPPSALVGITPGHSAATLLDFASLPSGIFSGVAETFASSDAVDVILAAQKFYQTHDDAYDYLVFYNAEGIPAGPGVVAYEMTTRSHGQGFGDTATEIGAEFGSPQRLKAVLNLGPVSQYPADPNAPVPARGPTGDTPLTLLGHESGHLFLALVSVPDQDGGTPMLGRAQVHWAFTFNSDASFLEGNRIADSGAAASPRFATTATVQHYSALDQYLMGFRASAEVPPTFAVLNSGQSLVRAPQTGVAFNGTPLNISIDDVIQVAGRRTPDSTVAQRHYRFAIVVIVPTGALATTAADAIQQVEGYRSVFENFFATATDGRATANTSLQRSATLSLAPAAGVLTGQNGTASITLANPAVAPLTFTLSIPNQVLSAPATVTIPAGATRVDFQTLGVHTGVEEFSAAPSDPSFETAFARVQVSPASGLHLETVTNGPPTAIVRVLDQNNLPYSNVAVTAEGNPPATILTDETGSASFPWSASTILVLHAGAASLTLQPQGTPAIAPHGVVNAASYQPAIAPGSLATIFGTNFAGAQPPQVLIDSAPVTPFYASATQLNFLAPANLLPGDSQLQVVTAAGSSNPVLVQINAHAPGVFAARQTGAALEIYCTGLGPIDSSLNVTIAGQNAPILYAGASAFPGLNQVNAQLPAGLPAGPLPLTLSIAGIASNTINLLLTPTP